MNDIQQQIDQCQHASTTLGNHIGHDVDEDGSSEQYVQHCNDCGMWRYATEVSFWDGRVEMFYGRRGWRDIAEAPLEVRM